MLGLSPDARRAVARSCAALAALVGIVALATFAPSAAAEEAIVLDNGTILRGNVVREEGSSVVFQLAGVGNDSRVTVEKTRIVQRFQTIEPRKSSARASPEIARTTTSVAVRTVETPPAPAAA